MLAALQAGFDARCTVGEVVTFRGAPCAIPLINRAPDKRDRARWNFTDTTAAIAEFSGTLSPRPTAGDMFTDSTGRQYRILAVTYNGTAFVVACVSHN